MASLGEAKILSQIKILNRILKDYQWLTGSYMLDFFTCELFEALPSSWKMLFKNLNIEEFGIFINWDKEHLNTNVVWPLSLLSLRKLMQHFTITRQKGQTCFSSSTYHCDIIPEKLSLSKMEKIKKIFLKHVKTKKRYEIETMAEKTASLACKYNVKWVVDIGSGLGHLIRALSYGYGINVVGIENQEQLIHRAYKLDKELETTAGKHLTKEEMEYLKQCRPHHKQLTIDFKTDPETLLEIVRKISGKNVEFGIVGLHPCGNLAPILLRIFLKSPNIKFINLIGCCYHKMTFGCDSIESGFPLSNAVKAGKNYISIEGAALGCHALEATSQRLILGDYEHLKVHCFRATLERIIQRRWPEHARCGLNNVRHYPELTFPEYCEKALKKLNLSVSPEDLNSQQTLEDLSRSKDAVFYHSLWSSLGPVVESAILLDRILFLIEQDIPSQLQAVFDPLISPRNHILSAMKK